MTQNVRQENRKEEIRDYIISYLKTHGYAPTVREIGKGIGLQSTSSVHEYLTEMFWEGTLETDAPGAPRAIRVPGYEFQKMHAKSEMN